MFKKVVRLGVFVTILLSLAIIGQSQAKIFTRQFSIASEYNGGVTSPSAQVELSDKNIQQSGTTGPCIERNKYGAQVVGCNLSTACLSIFLLAILAPVLCFLWNECVSYMGKKDKIFEGCSTPPDRSLFCKIKIISWFSIALLIIGMLWKMGIHF